MRSITTHVHPTSLCSFFFFLLLPPPPRSTLFPYTTLFRSSVSCRDRRCRTPVRLQEPAAAACPAPAVRASDRKSTRLNSSHRCISYAVFCLKKKNINSNSYVMLLIQQFCLIGRVSYSMVIG